MGSTPVYVESLRHGATGSPPVRGRFGTRYENVGPRPQPSMDPLRAADLNGWLTPDDDQLQLGLSEATAKVTRATYNHVAPALLGREDQQDVGFPMFPREGLSHAAGVHDPDKQKPWSPFEDGDSSLYKSHAAHKAWYEDQRAAKKSEDDDGGDHEPAWNRQLWIKRLPDCYTKFALQRKKRQQQSQQASGDDASSTASQRLRYPSPPLSMPVPSLPSASSDPSKPSENPPLALRVARTSKPDGVQAKMAALLTAHVEAEGLSPDLLAPALTMETVEAGEEYIIEGVEKHELEDIFDEPDRPIGAFDRNEVVLYFERERQKEVKRLRKEENMTEQQIADATLGVYGVPASTLERYGARAWRALVEAGKVLPKKIPSPKRKRVAASDDVVASPPKRQRRTPPDEETPVQQTPVEETPVEGPKKSGRVRKPTTVSFS